MAVHHYARHAADACWLAPHLVLMHVLHLNVVIRAGNASHRFHRFPTCLTAGAEYLVSSVAPSL
jgi:hypothetical protein